MVNCMFGLFVLAALLGSEPSACKTESHTEQSAGADPPFMYPCQSGRMVKASYSSDEKAIVKCQGDS